VGCLWEIVGIAGGLGLLRQAPVPGPGQGPAGLARGRLYPPFPHLSTRVPLVSPDRLHHHPLPWSNQGSKSGGSKLKIAVDLVPFCRAWTPSRSYRSHTLLQVLLNGILTELHAALAELCRLLQMF